METINLPSDLIQILGIHFSYNKQIPNKENFVKKILLRLKTFLKIWRMRNFTVKCKITVTISLAVCKTIHLALVINAPITVIKKF